MWTEIEQNYSGTKRHYHNLQHLDNIMLELSAVKGEIVNWSALLFTLYHHDIVYNALKSDNEKKSAELAEKRMVQSSVDKEIVELCKQQILATKSHLQSTDSDINYFNDADLSILGKPEEEYIHYYKNLRKEYAWYSDIVYKPTRIKVLNHFSSMDRIFKTQYFFDKFEEKSRSNILMEIKVLGGTLT